MTQRIDRERLDAIRPPCPVTQKSCERPECSEHCTYGDRLAALEHERDELLHSPVLQAVLDAIKGTIDTSTNIADHPNVKFAQMAEAALVSLQTAVRQYAAFMRLSGKLCDRQIADELAALLPDPAGTQLTNDDDDHARVDSERLTDRPRTAPTERR